MYSVLSDVVKIKSECKLNIFPKMCRFIW